MKYSRYGLKTEFSVLPTKFCINHSCQRLKSVSHISMFKNDIRWDRKAIKKIALDKNVQVEDRTTVGWTTSNDYGCDEISDYLLAIHHNQKLPNDILTPGEKQKVKR